MASRQVIYIDCNKCMASTQVICIDCNNCMASRKVIYIECNKCMVSRAQGGIKILTSCQPNFKTIISPETAGRAIKMNIR